MQVGVVIPAHDEEASIAAVIEAIPRTAVQAIVVGANCCSDQTAEVARRAGATVVREDRKGYGWACQTAINALDPDINVVVFLDGDLADDPAELPQLLKPIASGADLVIGSRVLGEREPGALLPQQRLGNLLATRMILWLWGHRYTDLGPFRAVRRSRLEAAGLREYTFGWTVELQIRAIQLGWRVVEVPVSYRRRIGISKVSGTLRGTLGAGWGIVTTILAMAAAERWPRLCDGHG